MNVLRDRADAGGRLAARVADLAAESPIVVGMARGGVPVGAVVAQQLGAPLDVLCVRKVGVPWQPELGVGALSEDGVEVANHALMAELGLTRAALEPVVARERALLDERIRRYRRPGAPLDVRGRVVILVDDGLATGYTARAGIETLRRRDAGWVVLAVPVAAHDTAAALGEVADRVVAVLAPRELHAVGAWYAVFDQTTDDAVIELLAGADARLAR